MRNTLERRTRISRIAIWAVLGVAGGLLIPTAIAGSGAGTPGIADARVVGASVLVSPAPTHESTLVAFNNSVVPGDFFSTPSDLPSLESFDNRTDQVFVEGFYSGVIDVLDARTNEVTATISAGEYANTVAFDQKTNALFFGLQTDDEVGFVNASTDLVERVVGIGFEPLALDADSSNGDLLVTGWNSTGTAFAAILSGTTGVVQSTFSFGADRFPIAGANGIAFDPANGDFYVPSIPSGVPGDSDGNLTVISAAHGSVVRNISLAFPPDAILYVPTLKEFYLGNASEADLSVFDPATRSIQGVVALPDIATMMVYGPNLKSVFVGIDGNVTVVDPGSGTVLRTFSVPRQPDGLAFDPRNDALYISDYVGNNVSVVNAATDRPITSVLLGAAPYNMAYDPSNGDLYVTDLESSQLIVLNATRNRVVGYVPLDTTPYGIAYDPQTRDLYVDDYYAGNVSVVSGATNSVIGYLPAGVEAWGIAYDGSSHDLWVTNPGSNNITILNPTSGTVVKNLAFSTAPGAIAYDAKGRTMFVGEYDTGNVSVFNATTEHLVRNSTTGSEPYTISIDSSTGDAFVGNYASDNVTVLTDRGVATGASIDVGVGVFGSAYDPDDHDVYVASFDSDLLSVISGASNSGTGGYSVGSGPVAVAVDPATGTVYVANYDSGSLTLLTTASSGGAQGPESASTGSSLAFAAVGPQLPATREGGP